MNHRHPSAIPLRVLLICSLPLLALVLATASGCQILGVLAAKAQGAPMDPAAYVPNKVPTLVLAEHSPASGVDDVSSEDIGRRTADFWNDQKIAPLVDLDKLDELRLQHPDTYDKMSIAAVGRAVGAKQVLYIDVRDSHDESAGGSDTIRAKASVRVKVVDADTGLTLWPPAAAEGYALDAQTQFEARGEGVSESTQMEQVRAMIADKIAKLFYKHIHEDQDN